MLHCAPFFPILFNIFVFRGGRGLELPLPHHLASNVSLREPLNSSLSPFAPVLGSTLLDGTSRRLPRL